MYITSKNKKDVHNGYKNDQNLEEGYEIKYNGFKNREMWEFDNYRDFFDYYVPRLKIEYFKYIEKLNL